MSKAHYQLFHLVIAKPTFIFGIRIGLTDTNSCIQMNQYILSAELDLSTYPSDTYIVRITTSSGITVKRIAKK